jgi:hypothetical protein
MFVLLTTLSFSAAASFGERRGHQSKELTGSIRSDNICTKASRVRATGWRATNRARIASRGGADAVCKTMWPNRRQND